MTTTIDEARLEELVGTTVTELSAAFGAVLALISDRFGLYRAMTGAGPLTAAELSRRTATSELYVREWLSSQAAGAIVAYDRQDETFTLPPEQAMIYADEHSPVFFCGGFDILESVVNDLPRLVEAFSSGEGMSWGDHHPSLFCGTERFFRAGYEAELASAWIPALDGVAEKLTRGGRVADLGCGHLADQHGREPADVPGHAGVDDEGRQRRPLRVARQPVDPPARRAGLRPGADR